MVMGVWGWEWVVYGMGGVGGVVGMRVWVCGDDMVYGVWG